MLRPVLLLVSGLVIFVVGGLIAFVRPVEFGWFAYAPLSNQPFAPGLVVLDTVALLGLIVAIFGITVVAGTAGYLLGRRRRPRGDNAQTGREQA